MTIAEAKTSIGRCVRYVGGHRSEAGVIVSANDEYVFVRYGADYGSKATRPEDLRLAN